MANASSSHSLRLAELMAAFSLAMDLGLGQPLEWVMRTCLLGVRLSELLGVSEDERRQVYYLSLLRHIGCTSTATMEAGVFGDELSVGEALITDSKHPLEVLGFLVQVPGKGRPLLERARHIGKALAAGPSMKDEVDRIQCEVAVHLAEKLDFEPLIVRAIGQMFERWDGRGVPSRLAREELDLPVRIAHLAHDAVTLEQVVGAETMVARIRKRAGRLYDPHVVDLFCRSVPELFAGSGTESTWEAILAAEPGAPAWLSESQLDDALLVIADFTDLKSPYLAGHSRSVAALAEGAAHQSGLPDSDARTLRQAGLVHDLGRVGVSAAIWNRPGPLNESEWERVRLHPYLTERILARIPVLTAVVELAVLHHERLDGSGYHRRLPAAMLDVGARILAAADTYQALTEPRPHRPARTPEAATDELSRQVTAGRLDAAAAGAVLSAAGHRVERAERSAPGGLSKREIEVLRLMVRGHVNREMAELLTISVKTVGHHVQHIYDKIGVSTRAGATLFAVQNGLLGDADVSA